jgi:hypothetical protein
MDLRDALLVCTPAAGEKGSPTPLMRDGGCLNWRPPIFPVSPQRRQFPKACDILNSTLAAFAALRHNGKMPRKPLSIVVIVVASVVLGGCSSTNSDWLVDRLADLPEWAGGMPKGVPPRPGTAEYDDYAKKLESAAVVPPNQRGLLPQAPEVSSKALY